MADPVRSHPSVFHRNHTRGCSRPPSPDSSAFSHLFQGELALGPAGRGGPGPGAQGQPPGWPLPLGLEEAPLANSTETAEWAPLAAAWCPGRGGAGPEGHLSPQDDPKGQDFIPRPDPNSQVPMQRARSANTGAGRSRRGASDQGTHPQLLGVSGWSLRRKVSTSSRRPDVKGPA